MGKGASKVGTSMSSGWSNFLNGKKQTYKKDALAGDFNSLGKAGMAQLREGNLEFNRIYSNPQAAVNNQIGIENKLMRGASEDAGRRVRELITQRGMGSSSVGLGQEINQNKLLSDKIAMNNASGTDRLLGINKERMNMGNALLSPKMGQGPVQMSDTKGRTNGAVQYMGEIMSGVGSMMGKKEGK